MHINFPQPSQDVVDRCVWADAPGGILSIKHVANCDSSYENQHLISGVALKKLWKMSIPPRLKSCLELLTYCV